MKCIGFVLLVAGQRKAVARLAVCPQNAQVPHMAGAVVLLTNGTQVLRKLNSVGIDRDVWRTAREYGAEYVVFNVPSVNRLYSATREVMDRAMQCNEGEGDQLHISRDELYAWMPAERGSIAGFPWPSKENQVVVKAIGGMNQAQPVVISYGAGQAAAGQGARAY